MANATATVTAATEAARLRAVASKMREGNPAPRVLEAARALEALATATEAPVGGGPGVKDVTPSSAPGLMIDLPIGDPDPDPEWVCGYHVYTGLRAQEGFGQ